MICPVCEKEIAFQAGVCNGCGQDLSLYKKAVSASNMYYNKGLEMAKVRDLSGAVQALKKSLKFNKRNIEARNLLGLVYYEMGEIVDALREWVLSKNFHSSSNLADKYMSVIQSSASALDNFNQAIKKYNSALNCAKQGNEDLAVMQLEKVSSLNPRFIRSYQLLALLYMKNGENKKAARCLLKANKIDKNNTLTLKYMKELPDGFITPARQAREQTKTLPEQEISPQVFQSGSYKEERFNFWPYVNLLIGAVLGIAVVYYLLIPTAKKDITARYEEQFKTYSDDMAAQNIESTQIANANAELEKEVKALKKEIEELKEEGTSEELYDALFAAINYYLDDDKEMAAQKLSGIKETKIENAKAKKIYMKIKEATFIDAAEARAEEGRVVYNSGKYEDAIKLFKKALKLDPDNTKAIYFMGRSYHRLGDKEKAREYYNKIINDYPDSDRVYDSTRRLQELGS